MKNERKEFEKKELFAGGTRTLTELLELWCYASYRYGVDLDLGNLLTTAELQAGN